MKTEAALLNEVLKRLELPSDYALAKEWGLSSGALGHYRSNRRSFDPYMVNRVAEALDKDPREVQAAIELAREPIGVRRAYWETLLKKFVGAAGLGALTALCIGTSSNTEAARPQVLKLHQDGVAITERKLTGLHIMRRLAVWIRDCITRPWRPLRGAI